MNTLGVAIRDRRRERRMTQEELATAAQVSRSTIGELEKHGRGTIELLERVADVLEMPEIPLGFRRLKRGTPSEDDIGLALELALHLLLSVRDAVCASKRADVVTSTADARDLRNFVDRIVASDASDSARVGRAVQRIVLGTETVIPSKPRSKEVRSRRTSTGHGER